MLSGALEPDSLTDPTTALPWASQLVMEPRRGLSLQTEEQECGWWGRTSTVGALVYHQNDRWTLDKDSSYFLKKSLMYC